MNLERLVIGELIYTSSESRIDHLLELEGYEFQDNICKSIFNSIVSLTMTGKEVDTISIFRHNQEIPLTELSKIKSETISDAYLSQHIYLLKSDKFKKELLKIIEANLEQIKAGQFGEDIEEVKNSLIIDLSGVSLDDKAEFEDVELHKQKIEEQFSSQKDIEGYSWGISDLDKWTSGILSPRVYVIGGLKKSGKTRFLIHTLKELHQQKIQTAFISLEMPGYEITKLLHSAFTDICDIKFRAASLISSEEKFEFKNVKIDPAILGIECKSGLGIEKIISRIRRYAKMGFKVIAIDYIQRISHNRNKQAQELEDISIRIADAARQYNVALVLLSQLNAAGENEAPNMGHLKGSGGIGESADTILLMDNLYRRTKKEDDRGKIDIFIEQRHGDSGKLSINADLGSCQFRNLFTGVTADGVF